MALKTLTGQTYLLPTEAQWECACRGRALSSGKVELTTDPYHFGKTITPKQANYADSKIGGTTKVGSYPESRNGFGLFRHARECMGVVSRLVWRLIQRRIVQKTPLAIRLVLIRAPAGCSGAVAGSTPPGSAARRTAAGSGRRTGAATSACASPKFRPVRRKRASRKRAEATKPLGA